eukprot:TRINITY_DN3870_c0_g2_i4.p1 TRINITY_DN3870_c0_g2~~TRINITY_DN3870_c0_g2_i4.p1  ORF type:complete len:306 (-),score=22.23 TRINITY_DN3870_c0_g2_i4:491-1408(-)
MADYVAGSVSNREFFVMSSVSMSSDGDFVPRTAYNEMKAERDRLQNLVDQLKLETAFLKASQPVSAAAELSCRDPPQAQGQPVAKRICVPLEVASISSLSSSSCPAVAVPRPTILSNDVDLNKVFRDMCKGPEGKPETYNRKEYHLVVHLVRAGSVDTGVHTLRQSAYHAGRPPMAVSSSNVIAGEEEAQRSPGAVMERSILGRWQTQQARLPHAAGVKIQECSCTTRSRSTNMLMMTANAWKALATSGISRGTRLFRAPNFIRKSSTWRSNTPLRSMCRACKNCCKRCLQTSRPSYKTSRCLVQ